MTVERAIGPGGVAQVVVRTRFERFPLSIKGAFVIRGADGNPHAIRFARAALSRIPASLSRDIPMEARQIDVAPNRDLFVPFEAVLTELEPGWYEVRSAVRVDAGTPLDFSSQPFAMPWPRTEIRRGSIPLGATVRVAGRSFEVMRVEMGTDLAAVTWGERRASEGSSRGQVEAALRVEGVPLDRLPEEAAPPSRLAGGEHRTLSYPLPRAAGSADVVVRLPTGEESEPIRVPLP